MKVICRILRDSANEFTSPTEGFTPNWRRMETFPDMTRSILSPRIASAFDSADHIPIHIAEVRNPATEGHLQRSDFAWRSPKSLDWAVGSLFRCNDILHSKSEELSSVDWASQGIWNVKICEKIRKIPDRYQKRNEPSKDYLLLRGRLSIGEACAGWQSSYICGRHAGGGAFATAALPGCGGKARSDARKAPRRICLSNAAALHFSSARVIVCISHSCRPINDKLFHMRMFSHPAMYGNFVAGWRKSP